MKILVTGAKGFVGRNLCAQLNNIKDGKAKCYGPLVVEAVYAYDIDSTPEELDAYCRDCDFVFNLAGVNRPQNQEEFMQGNFGFASTLLDTLKKYQNNCPVTGRIHAGQLRLCFYLAGYAEEISEQLSGDDFQLHPGYAGGPLRYVGVHSCRATSALLLPCWIR